MITLTIRTDNAAFQDGNRAAEVARILRHVAARIEAIGSPAGILRDSNGNPVGNVTTTGKDRTL